MFSPRTNRPSNILETDEEDYSDDDPDVSAIKGKNSIEATPEDSKDITAGSKKINLVDNLVDSNGITPNDDTGTGLKNVTSSRISPLGELKENAGPVLPENESTAYYRRMNESMSQINIDPKELKKKEA